MAIVFTSPNQQRQTMARVMVVIIIMIILGGIGVVVSFELNGSTAVVAPVANNSLKINFDIIESDQFKNLESFSGTQTEFTYIATDKNGKKIVGSMVAKTKDDVRKILEQMEFKISSIEEKGIGRSEPFSPYY